MNETTSKTALMYCRVSSEEQTQGFSLDAQQRLLKEYADKQGIKVVKRFSISESASGKVQRKTFEEMMRYAKEQNIKLIVCEKADRFARNFKDMVSADKWLEEDAERQIHLVKDFLILHKNSTSQEKLNWGIRILFAKNYVDNLSEETKKGLQEKFYVGWWPGWAPLGYLNKKESNKGIIMKDPEKWDLVKEALRMYRTGSYSALEIADIMYKKGLVGKRGKRLGNGIMISILKNPFYAGIMKWNKQEKLGNHEPMITPDEHSQILSVMSAHNQHACRRRKHSFLLRGFTFCGICGQRYTADKHRIGKNPDYYHCALNKKLHSNKGQNVEARELEIQAEEKFKDIQFSQDFIDLVVSKVKKFYEVKKNEKEKNKRILFNKKAAIEKKREVAEEKLIAGTLKDEDFVRMRERFREEIDILQGQIDEIENLHEVDTDTIRQVLMLSRNIYEAYKQAPYEIKRLYLGFFWEKFVIKDQKIISAEPTKLIKTLKNEGKIQIRHNWLRG